MESGILQCKCGGSALGYAEMKDNESDYRLIGIRCEKCGKEYYKSIKKMCSANTQQHAWQVLIKRWNDWSEAKDE